MNTENASTTHPVNPWLKLWTSPRASTRAALERYSLTWLFWIYTALTLISQLFQKGVGVFISDEDPVIALIIALATTVATMGGLALGCWIQNAIGKWLGSQALTRDVLRVALFLGLAFLLWIVGIGAVIGAIGWPVYAYAPAEIVATLWMVAMPVGALLGCVLGLWILIVGWIATSEVMKISIGRVIGITVILLLIGALLLAAILFGGAALLQSQGLMP